MRVIPIAPNIPASSSARTPAAAADCTDESDGRIQKVRLPLVRREFLKGSGVLIGTLAAGSLLATLAPSRVWAVELKTLSQSDAQTLIAMGRVLYPHERLPDAVYALLVKDLDTKAVLAKEFEPRLLKDGIAHLDKAAGGSFSRAPAGQRLAIVKAIEGEPFFNVVRAQGVTSIYDNDMAFAAFGYPGASWDKGGYITRGFQDLKWLPDPPLAASPPPYMG